MTYRNKNEEKEAPRAIFSQGRYWPTGTYWIIVNHVRQLIWKGVYYSYEDAKTEYDRQMVALRPGATGKNWKIELRMPNDREASDERRVDEEIKRQESDAELDAFIKNTTNVF